MTDLQKYAQKYKKSIKGIKTRQEYNKHYHQTSAYKEGRKRYAQSPAGKAARDKFKKSAKGLACRVHWQESVRGRMCSLLSSAKCRARRGNVVCTITTQDLVERIETAGLKCEVTKMKFDFSIRGGRKKNHRGPSLDQKIPGAGYTKENIQIVTVWFNHLKGDMTTEEAMSILNDWKQNGYDDPN